MASIYDYKVKKRDGGELDLADLKGKVILIVNTATGCGFTPQYEGLENLYAEYHDKGLEILDFPCNQFGHQAPGSDEEKRGGGIFPMELSGENLAISQVQGGVGRAVPARRCPSCRRTAPEMCRRLFHQVPDELHPHHPWPSLARSGFRRRGDSPPYPALHERKHKFFA